MNDKKLRLLKLAVRFWRQRLAAKRRIMFGCFFRQRRQNSSTYGTSLPSTSYKTINDLDDSIISNITSFLDTKDAYRLSQTCSRFRKFFDSQPLEPFIVTNKELVYRFNCRTGKREISLLKIGRSIQGFWKRQRSYTNNFYAENLTDLLIPHVIFKGTIIFESGVDVASAFEEIYDFFTSGQLQPQIFRFHGSSIPRAIANRKTEKWDADELSELFKEMSVKEVHFLASSHFDFKNAPASLLYLCGQLSHLSLINNEVPVHFRIEDIFSAAILWRSTSTSSSKFILHSPLMENDCTKLVQASQPFDADFDENDHLVRIVFFNPNDESHTLTFHFH